MKSVSQLFIVPCLTLLLVGTAAADIDPGQYRQLKRDATEQLRIRIESVELTETGDFQTTYKVVAVVTRAERTGTGLQAGDRVTFESYTTPRGGGFVGPPSPMKPRIGWQGRVYLRDKAGLEGGAGLTIGAYGQSYETGR
jgi:hypothetical protein